MNRDEKWMWFLTFGVCLGALMLHLANKRIHELETQCTASTVTAVQQSEVSK